MAYDSLLEDRINQYLKEKAPSYYSKKMMGGLCYMLDDKMLCGIIKNQLMARIGTDAYEKALQKEGCNEMNFTGRAMKGYVFVDEEAIDMDDDLEYWLDLCIKFNPEAKSSKKK